jgi:anti-sigma B factor antagonist
MVSESEGDPLDDPLLRDELGGQAALTISSRRDGARTIVVIDGELDPEGVGPLREEARRALASGAEVLEIDASRVRFVDSVGLSALLAIQSGATQTGMAFRIAAASDQFLRVVKLAGLSDILFPTD